MSSAASAKFIVVSPPSNEIWTSSSSAKYLSKSWAISTFQFSARSLKGLSEHQSGGAQQIDLPYWFKKMSEPRGYALTTMHVISCERFGAVINRNRLFNISTITFSTLRFLFAGHFLSNFERNFPAGRTAGD